MHTCPMVDPGPKPHVGGPIVSGAPTVIIGGMPAARVSDTATCVGPPDSIVKGSPTVLICNLMAARIGDNTSHGGVIVMGCPTVMIGESGSGGGGGGGGGGAVAAPPGDPGPARAAFKNAADSGTPLVQKGPCEACKNL